MHKTAKPPLSDLSSSLVFAQKGRWVKALAVFWAHPFGALI